MEIKTEIKVIPVTVNREVTQRVFVFTEAEALVLRDTFGANSLNELSDLASSGMNLSGLTSRQFKTEIAKILISLNNEFDKI